MARKWTALFYTLFLALWISGCKKAEEKKVSVSVPQVRQEPLSFVGTQACASCHQKEFQAWTGSDHQRAMQEANEKTVLGDFNNASFTYYGLKSTFFKKDNKFFVRTDGPDGKLQDYEIQYTF